MSPVLAAALAGLAAVGAWRVRALTASGAAAAFAVGTLLAAAAGWPGIAALLAFFVSSTAISRLERGASPLADPKLGSRDALQVLANGGVPAAAALLAALAAPGPLAAWVAAAGLAVAGADTWATAVGARSSAAPRHLITRQQVSRGTSGAVSLAGSAGALVGALLPAAAAALVARDTALFPAAVIIGWTGMLADSLLGATVQGRFHCPRCDVPSEWRRHRCGAGTTLVGGVRWLTNDGVNALATTFGALAGAAAWAWCGR